MAGLAGRNWHCGSRPMTNWGRVIGMTFPVCTPWATTRLNFMRRPHWRRNVRGVTGGGRPQPSGNVRVACPDGTARQVLERHRASWQARTGALVEIVTCPPGGDPATDADAWVIEPAALARWADAGRLQPVPTTIRERDDWEDLLGL